MRSQERRGVTDYDATDDALQLTRRNEPPEYHGRQALFDQIAGAQQRLAIDRHSLLGEVGE
ncbi:hypothetical protein WS62_09350 [Burkholderia sp. ABCPW 14]|nr:hypothetical protein WS62_09350 [Burkholderia sp. ABCPW 14]